MCYCNDDKGGEPGGAEHEGRAGGADGEQLLSQAAGAGRVLDRQRDLRQAAHLPHREGAVPVPLRQRQAERRRDHHPPGRPPEDPHPRGRTRPEDRGQVLPRQQEPPPRLPRARAQPQRHRHAQPLRLRPPARGLLLREALLRAAHLPGHPLPAQPGPGRSRLLRRGVALPAGPAVPEPEGGAARDRGHPAAARRRAAAQALRPGVHRREQRGVRVAAAAQQLRDREAGGHAGQAVPAAAVPRGGAEGQADLPQQGGGGQQGARDPQDQAGDGRREDQGGRDDRGDGPHQAGLQDTHAHREEDERPRLRRVLQQERRQGHRHQTLPRKNQEHRPRGAQRQKQTQNTHLLQAQEGLVTPPPIHLTHQHSITQPLLNTSITATGRWPR